ncbi:MAG: hypothetical protein ABFD07_08880 [Methanobacterium sp.]
MISSKPQGIDVFKSLIFLIMFFFGTVLQINAQQIEITFPQHGATSAPVKIGAGASWLHFYFKTILY